eukprot:gene7244-8052_t
MNKKLILLSRNLTRANAELDFCKTRRKINSPRKANDFLLKFNTLQDSHPNADTVLQSNLGSDKDFQKLVHIDLKGAPPTINYLIEVTPLLKKLGATGILIEYEDMFPYDGILQGISSRNAYKRDDIKRLLRTASENSLTIIPLLQSFGHLEFALKHKTFAHLREVPKYFDMLCPLKNGSKSLVYAMIDQIVDLHPGIKHLHVGGDEVFHLQLCETCFLSRKSKIELYLHHMIPILQYIHQKTNSVVKPIIWDDMLRRFNNKQLARMSKLTDIMVWSYIPDVFKYAAFPDNMWKKYALVFDKIWIAGSFKGGHLPNVNVPPVQMHIDNTISWMKVASSLPETLKVFGMALAGWSRFDHLATLCELFPAALPSLAVCLEILNKGLYDKYVLARVSDRLGLENGIQFKKGHFSNYIVESGGFPGSNIYSLVLEFENHISWYENIRIRLDSWGNRRQYQNNASSFAQIEGVKESLEQFTQSLNIFSKKATNDLQKVYFEKDVDEWMEDKVYTLADNVNKLAIRTQSILEQRKYN